jgi:hypothetical protein
VRLGEVGELHAAFLDESRTRGRWLEQRTGNPGISLVFREMWDSTALICEDSRSDANLKGRIRGIPHLAKNKRDARISCTLHRARVACAAFIEESRMKFINANKLHRKSGGVGHPSFLHRDKVK